MNSDFTPVYTKGFPMKILAEAVRTVDYSQPSCLHANPFDACIGHVTIDGIEGQLWHHTFGITEEYRFAPLTAENRTPYGPRYWYPVTAK